MLDFLFEKSFGCAVLFITKQLLSSNWFLLKCVGFFAGNKKQLQEYKCSAALSLSDTIFLYLVDLLAK